MSSAICFNLDQSKFLSSGNGLMAESSEMSTVKFPYRKNPLDLPYIKHVYNRPI